MTDLTTRVLAAQRPSGPACVGRHLAPADIRKERPSDDLPIAVGVLIASQQAVADARRAVFLGELALDGNVRHSHGVLPMVGLAKARGIETVTAEAYCAELGWKFKMVTKGWKRR